MRPGPRSLRRRIGRRPPQEAEVVIRFTCCNEPVGEVGIGLTDEAVPWWRPLGRYSRLEGPPEPDRVPLGPVEVVDAPGATDKLLMFCPWCASNTPLSIRLGADLLHRLRAAHKAGAPARVTCDVREVSACREP